MDHPVFHWDWNIVFNEKDFDTYMKGYVDSQFERILLVNILDDRNKETVNPKLDNSLLVLYNDYHISNILPFI